MNFQQICIKEPFTGQYILKIEMDSAMVDSKMESVVEARYNFNVLDVKNSFFDCRLIQTDYIIRSANNELIKEIAVMTAAFNRMFSELHLRLSHAGDII